MVPCKTFRLLLVALLLSACNSETNLIGRTVPDDHHDSYFYNLDMARALYDGGRAKQARKYALKAFSMDPDSEEASLLLGYIDLSLAGGDPFTLAKALMEVEQAKKDAAAKTDSQTTPATSSGESGASDTLGSVKAAIGITDEELALLGRRDDSDPELPVIIPKCAEDARAAVERLTFVNEAIRAVCPFVDDDIRSEADYRQICDESTRVRRFSAKAHFLWAFAHLTEALAFNSVLTFSGSDSTDKRSNMEKRVTKVQSQDTSTPEGITSLLDSLKGVEATVNAIFPASGLCSDTAPTSQLRATLNDMLAVDIAFSRISGVPDKIVASIRKSMTKITGLGGQGGVGSQLAAMKADFTKKISGGLSTKVDQLVSNPDNPLPADKKDEICSILSSIAAGGDSPDSCN
jgi:hypothetical protein